MADDWPNPGKSPKTIRKIRVEKNKKIAEDEYVVNKTLERRKKSVTH